MSPIAKGGSGLARALIGLCSVVAAVNVAAPASGAAAPVSVAAPASGAAAAVSVAAPARGAPAAARPAAPGGSAATAAWPSTWPALRPRASAATVAAGRISRPTWLSGVTITEYYSAPERWFNGRRVAVNGISGLHRIDWLFSARGVTMQGDGIGLDGRHYHVVNVGRGGWVGPLGQPASIGGTQPVFWRAGAFWRNARGQLTYPFDGGGWSNGVGLRYVPLFGSSFAPGMSLPLRPYHSLAVDPSMIPLGSRVYIPAYHGLGGGWFTAQDTGGAIDGAHVDVYRSPPARPDDARYLTRQRMLVVPPGQRAPAQAPSAPRAPSTSGSSTGSRGGGGAATGGSAPRG